MNTFAEDNWFFIQWPQNLGYNCNHNIDSIVFKRSDASRHLVFRLRWKEKAKYIFPINSCIRPVKKPVLPICWNQARDLRWMEIGRETAALRRQEKQLCDGTQPEEAVPITTGPGDSQLQHAVLPGGAIPICTECLYNISCSPGYYHAWKYSSLIAMALDSRWANRRMQTESSHPRRMIYSFKKPSERKNLTHERKPLIHFACIFLTSVQSEALFSGWMGYIYLLTCLFFRKENHIIFYSGWT